MLLGREAECARIDQLLENARTGLSGGVLLTGEPGIGKSALCAYARQRADGFTVLSARGVESETELSFAGLFELVRRERFARESGDRSRWVSPWHARQAARCGLITRAICGAKSDANH